MNQLENLEEIRKIGVEVLLIQRTFVPPEQAEEHNNLCQRLKNQGVTLAASEHRNNAVYDFLSRKYLNS